MSAPAGEALAHARIPEADRVAHAWTAAVRGTSFVSMNRRELQGFLGVLAGRLIAAAITTDFDRAVAFGVGESLVAAHFTEPRSLECTLATLGGQLAPRGRDAAAGGPARRPSSRRSRRVTRKRCRTAPAREQQQISAAALRTRDAAEEARWASEARFGALFADAIIGISVADTDGRIVEVNRALCEMLGYTVDELADQSIYTFIHPDDEPGVWEQIKEMMAGAIDHLRLEKAYFRKDGAQVWTDLVLSLIRDPQGEPRYLVAMVEDITERHYLQDRLRHQAEHDALTGLPSRTLFFERLDAALAVAASDADAPLLGVCYLDLDGFKVVNDTRGHDAGDRLLQEIATRLHDALTRRGHLVARMGGDEFVVLVEGRHGCQSLEEAAQCALDVVRQPVRLGEHEVMVSASAGVVARHEGGASAADLMKAADTTLYWAKNDGRDRYALFDRERHRSDVQRFEMSTQMPDALRNGEFVLDYQPLVRLADRQVTGVEALVRWQRPDGERLRPDRFISLAEETGAIVALGAHVLTAACRQARAWYDADPSIRLLVSVNLAARQVREPAIAEDVARILDQTGWPPDALQLELTESDLMGTTRDSMRALHTLAEMGVRIAIDDFGTGYSNLAYLHSLPVHELKLAGPFVNGEDTEDNRAILTALINLAHTLGLTVTAESVETAEQARRLSELGCDTGQGWYFGHPGPPEAIATLLR